MTRIAILVPFTGALGLVKADLNVIFISKCIQSIKRTQGLFTDCSLSNLMLLSFSYSVDVMSQGTLGCR